MTLLEKLRIDQNQFGVEARTLCWRVRICREQKVLAVFILAEKRKGDTIIARLLLCYRFTGVRFPRSAISSERQQSNLKKCWIQGMVLIPSERTNLWF